MVFRFGNSKPLQLSCLLSWKKRCYVQVSSYEPKCNIKPLISSVASSFSYNIHVKLLGVNNYSAIKVMGIFRHARVLLSISCLID